MNEMMDEVMDEEVNEVLFKAEQVLPGVLPTPGG